MSTNNIVDGGGPTGCVGVAKKDTLGMDKLVVQIRSNDHSLSLL